MVNTPTLREAFGESFRKAVASWNEFFFKPRLPHTLGLMRICAGIFILYVHLAHTWDLYSLFGPDAWSDLQMTDTLRKTVPFLPPPMGWSEQYNLSPPAEHLVREAVLMEWMQNLPTDPARRRQALAYLDHLPVMDGQADVQALALAEYVTIRPKSEGVRANRQDFRPATDDERKKLLDALTRPQVDPTERDLVPQEMQKLALDKREAIRQELLDFVATLPRDPGDTAMVMLHLQSQSVIPIKAMRPDDPRTELQHTLQFLTRDDVPQSVDDRGPFLPNDLAKRRQVLEYMTRWTVDPRRTLGTGQYVWSAWFHVTNKWTMAAVHGLFLVAMALFAAGLWTRVTSVVTWIALLSYVNRSPQMVFGMDTMMNIAMIYLMVGPSGAVLSLDRWLEKRRAQRDLEKARSEKRDTSEYEAILAGPKPSIMAGFVTRLVQIHFCFIYAASGLAKLKGPAWWNHTAMWSTMVNPEFSPVVFQPYMWLMLQLAEHRWLAEIAMSFGTAYTLFLEIGFPFLVWRPLLRPYMVMMAILLHTGIAVFMGLTVFGLFMLVLLMAYIPPETVKRWLEAGERKPESAPTPQSAAIPALAR
jgi:hypothetical protein